MSDKLWPGGWRKRLQRLTSHEGNRRLVTGGLITTACRLLSIASLLLCHVLNARLMSQSDVGVYFTLWSAAVFLSVVATLGLRTSVITWIADAEQAQDWSQARAAIQTTLRVAHASLILTGGMLCVIFWVTSNFSSLTIFNWSGAGLYAGWVFTLAASYALPEIFRGFHRYWPAGIFSGVLHNALNALLLGWLFMSQGQATLHGVLMMNVLAGLINYAACMGMLMRLLSQLPRGKTWAFLDAWVHAWPIMVANASRSGFEVLDAVLVGFVAGPQQAALYGPAGRLAALLHIPNQIMISTATPAIAQAHAHQQKTRLEALLRGMSTAAVLPGLACTLLFVLAGQHVMAIVYGPSYVAAAPALCWLAFGNLVHLFTGAAGLALTLADQQRVVMRLNTVVTIVTLVAIAVTAAFYGATGAACVRGLMLMILAMLQQAACRRLLGVASAPYLLPRLRLGSASTSRDVGSN